MVVHAAREVVADHGRARIERAAGIHNRLQLLVVHIDQLQRVPRAVTVVGDQECDLLAVEADLVACQHRLNVA